MSKGRLNKNICQCSRERCIFSILFIIIGSWYFSSITRGALWGDEVQYALAGITILSGNPFVNIVHMFAPFGKYIIGIGQLIFGSTSFGARVGIVLTSLVTLVILYYISERLGNPYAGIFSVIALSVLPIFATHATSAMLDMPLVAGVTTLCGLVLLEAEGPGTKWRDIAVGATVILIGATKAYGFVYVAGPIIAYIAFRNKNVSLRTSIFRAGIAASVSSIIIYAPLMLTTPPKYYSGVKLPAVIMSILNLPIVGGPTYAFGSSLYFNMFAGHEGSTSPSLATIFIWLAEAGPLVLVGVMIYSIANFTPQRLDSHPRWLPAILILPPLFIFTLILPKGYSRFVLPLFPIAILLSNLLIIRGLSKLSQHHLIHKLAIVIIIILAVSPASAFVFGDHSLSADSQYDDVSEFLNTTESDIKVVTNDRHELMWYLGDRYTERYYVYLDPTIWREYSTEDGNNISIVGASTDVPLARQIEDDSIDYVVLSERSGQFERVDRLPNAERIQTFSAYNTGRRTHLVAIWKVKNGSEQNINGTNSNFIVSETRKKQN